MKKYILLLIILIFGISCWSFGCYHCSEVVPLKSFNDDSATSSPSTSFQPYCRECNTKSADHYTEKELCDSRMSLECSSCGEKYIEFRDSDNNRFVIKKSPDGQRCTETFKLGGTAGNAGKTAADRNYKAKKGVKILAEQWL